MPGNGFVVAGCDDAHPARIVVRTRKSATHLIEEPPQQSFTVLALECRVAETGRVTPRPEKRGVEQRSALVDGPN
jgi:hypothetical protein